MPGVTRENWSMALRAGKVTIVERTKEPTGPPRREDLVTFQTQKRKGKKTRFLEEKVKYGNISPAANIHIR